ncbi:MAG TPA: Hpt domain-containing protein [Lachnospiraceae bacterium]|nr:Hpt domain-containing protein [Lachnospiraceae bacterium]
MNTILSKLDAWGCDITGAMNRCFGDTDFYLRWVTEFAIDPGFEKLDHALLHENYEEAFQTAHGLKGDAGMLGLTPLLLPLCALVEDLRNEPSPNLEKDYESVKEAYERYVNILRSSRTHRI